MALRDPRLKRRLLRILPVLAALVVLLVSLVLVSDVQQEASGYNRIYVWVVVLTVVALALLFLAIITRVVSLVRKVRAEEPGARLSARWVRNFLALSLPPVLIVYFFAALFLTRIVDNWFDVEVESALEDSLALGQQFLDQRTLEARNRIQRLAEEIDPASDAEAIRELLLTNVRRAGPTELSVFDRAGRLRATANFDALANLPDLPDDYALLQTRERGEYAAAEPAARGGLHIRVLRQLTGRGGREQGLLQALYPLPREITALTDSIEREYYRYQTVSLLRNSLKYSFLLILSLVLLLTVLLAILAALAAARRLVSPISGLALATERVAGGDLEQAVEIQGRDEIAFLAHSFNDMTRALLSANEEAERGRARLQAQGEYLETVLGSLSAGVLTLDSAGRVQRLNRAGERILGLAPSQVVNLGLAELAQREPELAPLIDTVAGRLERARWQREIPLERHGASLVLLARGSTLSGADGSTGHVVVFDDVTVLNQAQRDAAWAEAARRMAHEVKNPLTPIRLAAERLRMKLTDKLGESDAEMLDRSATTIVAQVEALRRMVDAFGDYARERERMREPVALDELVRQVTDLYRQGNPNLAFGLDLCEGPPGLVADGGQLRQLLHNLIRNALEASAPGTPVRIGIRSRVLETTGDRPLRELELVLRDDGPGFPVEVLAQPFEPYVTHKPGGSGLGLAICRKIVVDHDGVIEIDNPPGGGARTVIRLPLTAAAAPSQDTPAAEERSAGGG